MTKTVEAIYENGVFKPVKKVKLPEHKKIKLTISPIELAELIGEDEEAIKQLVERQRKAFLKKLQELHPADSVM
jgi:predicted DNA-binding antitoxin AbrB/MazE fold protein